MPEGQRYRQNNPPVVAEIIEGEVVAIDLKSGRYFSLFGPATEIWRHLVAGYSPAEILAAANGGSEGQTACLHRFVAELVDEGLICPRDDAGPSEPLPAVIPWQDGALKVEGFNDMQDMLTIDPIHDIDTDFGWPRPASDTKGS